MQPPDTNTVLGAMQGSPGEGTSIIEGPTIHFLHWLLSESPKLEKEMARLHQTMMKEQGILEEEFQLEK